MIDYLPDFDCADPSNATSFVLLPVLLLPKQLLSSQQTAAHLHVNRAAACHHMCVLQRAAHDHDGVVQAALGLVDELLTAAAQHDGGGARLGAAREQVVALATNLQEVRAKRERRLSGPTQLRLSSIV
jgi:hypothetical protein